MSELLLNDVEIGSEVKLPTGEMGIVTPDHLARRVDIVTVPGTGGNQRYEIKVTPCERCMLLNTSTCHTVACQMGERIDGEGVAFIKKGESNEN